MALTLVAWTPEDLAARRPGMTVEFAEMLVDSLGIAFAEAEAESARQLDQLLPEGVHSPGQFLFKAVDDGVEVGLLWLAMPGTMHPSMAWVAEIDVLPQHQSQGHGTTMMLAAEREMLARGVDRLGLNVFGTNHGARRLYERLGYRVLSQFWQQRTASVDGPCAQLRQMTAAELVAHRDAAVKADPVAFTRNPHASAEAARERAGGIVSGSAWHAYVEGRRVGWVWVSPPADGGQIAGAVNYLAVDADRRRRGLGRAVFTAASRLLAADGVALVSWTLGPAHDAARGLSQALGMELGAQQMEKELR
jgi:mycothiol synthase